MRRVLVLLIAACAPNAPPSPVAPLPPGPDVPRQLRRLSNAELDAVASELVGQPLNLTDGFLQEPRVDGFDNDAQALIVTDAKLDDFVAIAETVASKISAPGCEAEPCALAFASELARKAYGRPLTPQELERLGVVYRAGENSTEGLRLVVEAMLLSPHFAYRTELGVDGRLTQLEAASAISFLFLGTRPDAPLLEAALTGQLDDSHARVRHARRLLATDRGQLHLRELLLSWLDLHDMEQVSKSPAEFGFFTLPVRQAMATELALFLDDAAYGADGTLRGLFTSSRAFPNPTLQPIYASGGPVRRGILSLPGFLAHHSAVDHTAPVMRGLFIRARLLCDEIAPPPPLALANPPNPGDHTRTNRQKYAAHSNVPACVGCHHLMDPIGFGLENFDPVGRYQTVDNAQPIDGTGVLEGTDIDGPFTGPAELGVKLGASAQVRRCFASTLR